MVGLDTELAIMTFIPDSDDAVYPHTISLCSITETVKTKIAY